MQQGVAQPQGDRLRVRAGLRRELYRQERVRAGVGGSLLFGNSRGVVGLSGQAKALATSFGDEEAEHVAALTKAITGLGGKPVKKPTFVFPANSAAGFLSLATPWRTRAWAPTTAPGRR
jgi:hypothetical protein